MINILYLGGGMNKNIEIKKHREKWNEYKEFEYSFNRKFKREDWRDKLTVNSKMLSSPFGVMNDGKLDLRGIPLRETMKYQNIKDIDFSYCYCPKAIDEKYGPSSSAGIIHSVVEDSLFIYSELPQGLGDIFRRCMFNYANMKRCRLEGIFDRCIFHYADLSNHNATRGTKFIACDFSGAVFKSAVFQYCIFDNCIFDDVFFQKDHFPIVHLLA